MSEAAWNKAFTQGSRALQDRLKKVHASNPKFQAWMQKSGHGAGASVKQASKEVKPSARVKSLQTKSLQAYGATKGTKVGGEHGSGEMRDTIAPLTRDQHSKVQAAERAAKAAAKKATPAKPKKPLSQAERMAAIAKAVTKAKSKDRFDVPTVNPDDVDHDDLRDVHQSLHVSRSYNEQVELDEVSRMMDKVIKKPSSDDLSADVARFLERGGKVTVYKPQKAKFRAGTALASKHDTTVARAAGGKGIKRSQIGKNLGLARAGLLNKMLTTTKKEKFAAEEVQLDEVTKQEAEKALGGPVKTRTGSEPKGKLPLGFRRARNLARKAMKTVKESTTEVSEVNEMNHGKKLAKMIMAKQSQHPIAQNMGEENIVEQDDSMEKKEMAQTQLHFMAYAAKEILEFIDMGGEIEEWYQNKLSKVQSEVESLHSYIEGEKRRTGMVEETEQVDEKIDLEKAKMGDVIKDFQKSDAPQFKGKSMEKRREMAIAAKLGAERANEEVEQDYEDDEDEPFFGAPPRGTYKKVYNKHTKETLWHATNKSGGISVHDTEEKAKRASNKKLKEEVDQVEEKYMGFKAVMAAAKKGGARDPAAVAASIGRKKYGKEKFQAMAAAAGKKLGEEVDTGEADARKTAPSSKEKQKEIFAKHKERMKELAKEEFEQTDEAVRVVDIEKKGKLPKKQDVRDRLAQAAKERRKITGASGVKGFNKDIGFAPTKYMDTSYVRAIKKEEVEQVTEAEGTVAVTPKEKALAAHHGDPKKITYGDVIKARLKSAAAKKMGNK